MYEMKSLTCIPKHEVSQSFNQRPVNLQSSILTTTQGGPLIIGYIETM